MHVEKSDVTATFTHSSPPMDTATPLNIFIGVVAALSSLVAVLVTSRYIDQCLRAWQGFPSQRHVILLSTLIPAYAILAWISVLFPEFALYIVVFMDMYEVFAIFHFMELMKAYMGGWHSTVRRMQTQPPVRLLVFQIRAQENTLFVIHCFVVQFIIIKPSISLLQAGLEHFELLTRDINLASPFLYLVALKGLSLAGAMIALIVFYRFSRDILSSYNIIKKFLIVKLVIFLNILQNFIFGALAARELIAADANMSSAERSYRIMFFLVCLEMAVLAFVFPHVFPPNEKSIKHSDELDVHGVVLSPLETDDQELDSVPLEEMDTVPLK